MPGLACYRDMRGWLAPAILLTTVLLAPSAAAELTQQTDCFGGLTEPATPVSLPSGHRIYMAQRDRSTFVEDNGVAGLQRSARICYDQTIDHSTEPPTVVASTRYTLYEADSPLVGGGGSCVPLIKVCAE